MSADEERQRIETWMGLHSRRVGASEHPCPYRPGLTARDEVWVSFALDPRSYGLLLGLGFRRAGNVLYRPRCRDCQACIPLRVPVATFRPSRSQRRALRRNRDLKVRAGPPEISEEKHALYQRYLNAQHPGTGPSAAFEDLETFLYASPTDTLEIEYRRPEGRLLAVSILDLGPTFASSVYHFFDPEEGRRSLGTFSVVQEIALCRSLGLAHYHLGFWIEGCPTMDYKATFGPHEILESGAWHRRERVVPNAPPPPEESDAG